MNAVSPECGHVGLAGVDETSHGREARTCRQQVQVCDVPQEAQTKGTLGAAHGQGVTWEDEHKQMNE